MKLCARRFLTATFSLSLLIISLLIVPLLISAAVAQDIAPPIPQKLVVHSNILNEDRVIWVRTPHGYESGKDPLPVLYLTDGPGHINEIGSTIDFLVDNGRMPPLIVVGIANTDRTHDLTPTHSSDKDSSGKEALPTSGGGDHFFDFIQTELMPEIEKRYRTAPYKLFAGHSLGGLMAIHILTSRPDMFQAYIAVSPSLWWDHQHTLHQAQDFLATHDELDKTLFFSLGGEGAEMQDGFDQLKKSLTAKAPKDFRWDSARFPDETHSSTVLRAHYAGLRMVFADWPMARDKDGSPIGGMAGIEQHYRDLSLRYGYTIPVPENVINDFGYRLMGDNKFDEAIAVFKHNVDLYPGSANVYDSLGEAYENVGKFDLATAEVQKAVDIGTKANDPQLDAFKRHLKQVTDKAKAAGAKAAEQK
jgi:predicted alpha/beta superfamily hydrolase